MGARPLASIGFAGVGRCREDGTSHTHKDPYPSVPPTPPRLTQGLPGGVVHLQVEGLRVGPLHHCHIVPRPFIGLGQGVGAPVGPVHLPPIEGDSKGVREVLVAPQHLNVPRAIVQG